MGSYLKNHLVPFFNITSLVEPMLFLLNLKRNLSEYVIFCINDKNYILLNSAQEFIEIEAWLLLTFLICLHNQLSSVYSTIIFWKEQIFEKVDLSNRQKKNGCSFQQILRQNFSWFFSKHRKALFLSGFILEATENGTKNFQNSPPFAGSACL